MANKELWNAIKSYLINQSVRENALILLEIKTEIVINEEKWDINLLLIRQRLLKILQGKFSQNWKPLIRHWQIVK